MENSNIEKRTSGLAVTSLVLGIIGLFTIIFFIPQLLAVIFGHVALPQFGRNPNLSGKGMAIAGLVLGWIGMLGALLYLLIFVIGVAAAAAS